MPEPKIAPEPGVKLFTGREASVDRVALAEAGFVLPDQRPGPLAEEFRIVKRQLLLRAAGEGGRPVENSRTILVCSAKPDEGKTFCAINLALSMAREKDLDIVLADGDFSKPEIAKIMSLEEGPGIIDALADPAIDIEACIVKTDIPNLSVLPAGRPTDDATELLASQRTRDALHRLTANSPTRIVIFDSPPALSASPASVLAMHAGQAVMVVKADVTSEAELREALGLLDGCRDIQLLLNGVTFAPNGKRFSSYYGYGD
jgi:exopolysaccharide/PEP-CTERM locus tyrosine autokinase